MTYAKRRDANHQEILQALRRIGAGVIDLAGVGRGCPDCAVHFRGQTWLLEIKSRRGRISEGQAKWLALWPGLSAVVRSVEEAIGVVTGRAIAQDAPIPDAAGSRLPDQAGGATLTRPRRKRAGRAA